MEKAVRANAFTAIEAENVLLILLGLLVNYAGIEELLTHHRPKPTWYLLIVQLHIYTNYIKSN